MRLAQKGCVSVTAVITIQTATTVHWEAASVKYSRVAEGIVILRLPLETDRAGLTLLRPLPLPAHPGRRAVVAAVAEAAAAAV